MAQSSLKGKSKGKASSRSESQPSWEGLPNEVLETVFSFLDGRSIGRAHAVCRQWHIVLDYMSTATGSLLWFTCCKSEIPKYTLLHLCNHPIDQHHRASLEWRDIYVRWCSRRGRHFCEGGARLDVKKVVQRSPGEIQHQALLRYVCFTDDLVFVLENNALVVYDMHSDASMRAQLPESEMYPYSLTPVTAVLMTTLGMRLPVNKRGKTDFQIAVDSTPVVVRMCYFLRIYVGLQCICSVPLITPLDQQMPVCSWYDTILLDSESAEGLSVYRFNLDSTTAPTSYDLRKECSLRLTELYGAPDSAWSSATIIGDKVLTLTYKYLTVWDASTAQILSYAEQPPHYLDCSASRDISWVGGIVATAQTVEYMPAVLLYKLDEGCANIQKVTWLQHGIYPHSLRVLYDDSLWVINQGGSEILLRTGNSGASGKSNQTPQSGSSGPTKSDSSEGVHLPNSPTSSEDQQGIEENPQGVHQLTSPKNKEDQQGENSPWVINEVGSEFLLRMESAGASGQSKQPPESDTCGLAMSDSIKGVQLNSTKSSDDQQGENILCVINEGGSELLLRTGKPGASGKSNRTHPQPTEVEGHIPAVGQLEKSPQLDPESNGENSTLLTTDGTELSTPDHDNSGISTPDHDTSGVSTQDHCRIKLGTLDSIDNVQESLMKAAIGGALFKTGRTKLSNLECSGDRSSGKKGDRCAIRNETVPDVMIHPTLEHSRDEAEYVTIGAGNSNYSREGQASRHFSSCRSDAIKRDLSSSTAAKEDEDVYRQNLSQLLGIGEDSPLWHNYSKSAHHVKSRTVEQHLEHFQADDDDEEDGYDDDDTDEEYDDDDEDNCIYAFESNDGLDDNCDHPSSRGDRFRTPETLYLPIRNESAPFVVDIPSVEGITLTREDIVRPKRMPLEARISHQGCETIACRFAFTDSAVAMVSLCHSPCRDIFVLYKL